MRQPATGPYRLVRRAPQVSRPVLGPQQRVIVDHRAGPLLVLGGPGTGKTTALVEAVAARVADGCDPGRVLVLTFGRRTAGDLKARISARIGRTTGEPLVRTFHAYAYGLLRAAGPEPRLISGPEQDLLIRELLAGGTPEDWPAELRPALATRGFAGELRDLLLRAAERGVTADQLAAYGRPDWAAAARFLRQYDDVLALRDATGGTVGYDHAEIVRAAIGLLRGDGDRLDAERRRIRYAYVDELPDTDPAQVDLLRLVAGGGRHLVAFADPDSSTYAFRGADPAVVADFPHRFPTVRRQPAPTVTLTTCWRAGPELIAATRRVASRLRGPARHRALRPAGDPPPRPAAESRAGAEAAGQVEVRLLRSGTQEAAYVAHRLREAHLRDGVPWSAMAVIVRSTVHTLGPLRRALQRAGVPVVVAAEDLPLSAQPAVVPLLLLVRCALEPDRLDEDTAVALLNSPYGGADPLAERRLRQGLRALGASLADVLRDPKDLIAIEDPWAAPARRVARLLAAARQAAGPGQVGGAAAPGQVAAARQAAGPGQVGRSAVGAVAARGGAASGTVEDVLWAVWSASGLARRWAELSARGGPRGASADRDLDAMMVLFDAAARFVDRLPGARAEVFVDHVLGQELPADTLAAVADRGHAVRILTAHAAKGREWDVVAVAGVQEGVWPDLRPRGSLLGSELLVDLVAGRRDVAPTAAMLDEERRLFYVATTRATGRLIVTAVASGDGEEQPSRFLGELVRDPAEAAVTLPRALTLPALVAELRVVASTPDASPDRRRAAAAQLARLAEAGVPGAHPDEWWGLRPLSDDRPLRDLGEPVTVSPSTVDAVRRCGLRWLLERHGGGDEPSVNQEIGNLVHAAAALGGDPEAIAAHVRKGFEGIDVPAKWQVDRERDRAVAMVDRLVGWLVANPRTLLAVEHEFAATLDDPDHPVEIKGRVDRLETDEDGRLVVVDLKTGKAVPPDAAAPENPQLAAYQAAVEAGAFGDADPGGAALVQLGTDRRSPEQWQPPLAESTDPGWAATVVRETAASMAASTFHAVANDKCRTCPVRTSCPVSGKGRTVTG